jgi:hypothetical protein
MEQSAVEWQFEQLFNSFENFNNGKYTFDEYLSNNLKIREQAKNMEKQQIIDAWEDGQNSFPTINAEKYYKEQFKNK